MQFEDQTESDNIEDRRGEAPPMAGGHGFGGFHLPFGRGMGLGGLLILLAVAWLGGIDPRQLLHGPVAPTQHSAPRGAASSSPAEAARKKFVGQVLRTTERCWHDLFPRHWNRRYEEPKLVLFRDAVRSACGVAGASVGPFYCPGDSKVYLDLAFFDEMANTLGARGDFAQAYVIAHEVGHHVQNLLGSSRRVQALRGRASEAEQNRASVQLELQADYFAGVWAHYVKHQLPDVTLDADDYEEAITAARAVGDDTLQRRATGSVMPEKFTHGTAAQRSKWFGLGFASGDPTAHDPFRDEK
jgi:predicted metalloprotease